MAEADPATKLRTVLDYVPCEACLSQPVADQELLCSVCRRLDRQVGVRVAVRTTVILERPSAPPPPEPVVIPPAPPAPEPQAPVGPAVEVVSADAPPRPKDAPPAIEVVVEPLVESAPAPPPEEPEWDDVASFQPADDLFGKAPGEPEPSFRREEAIPEEAPPLEDDYVLNPPRTMQDHAAAEEPVEEWLPVEEPPAEPAPQEDESQWGPPPDEPEELEIVETEIVEDEAPAEETWRSDLWRLPGFDQGAATALGEASVREMSHLSGHDAGELAGRTGLDAARLAAWIHVADLVQEVGVPVQAALALVAGGVDGPRGLREMDAEAIVERAPDVKLAEVKRWKRRA